jgi:hypothetical protein
MKPKAAIPSLALLAQAILSFSFCAARPHAHGHSHDDRVHYAAEKYTVSSGSNLIFNSAAVKWGEIYN